jgi:alkanesulfonate monooxygenase SsuD/methylene tetrahydromethanopterin reductase-like flavin-dependent oxidoreductase (luciferase family)
MPHPTPPLRQNGFHNNGLFDPADPAAGHESTLRIIELGERLGFDSAWLRHRHLQFGISSPVAVLAAASQRTSRIELGTAVTPLGWENPLRLAEDLATVDLLAGGRINPGVSVGEPMHYDTVKHELYPDSGEQEDFSYGRVERFAHLVAGEPVREFSGRQGVVEEFSNRVEPHSGRGPTGSTCSPAAWSSLARTRTRILPSSSSRRSGPSAKRQQRQDTPGRGFRRAWW